MTTRLARCFSHGADLDSAETTLRRRRIIFEKPFLRQCYEEWYGAILEALPPGPGRVLEIGSGPGFLRELISDLVASDVLPLPDLSLVASAEALPLREGSLRAIVLTDVLHHIPQPQSFLREATRCVREGGKIVMVEPWVTRWSRFVYGRLHHEPFRPDATDWEFRSTGPLSGANVALPWIIFERDRARFDREFGDWQIESIRLWMPFRYLLSGGFSFCALMPARTFDFWRSAERWLARWMQAWAMFARIVLVRTERARSRPAPHSDPEIRE